MAVDGVPDGWEVVNAGAAPAASSFTSAIGQPLSTSAHPIPEGEPAGIDAVTQSDTFQRAAHPQTLTDVGHLILAPTDMTRGAIANLPTVMKAAGDVVSGAKEQLGSFLSSAAHPVDTLDRIAKHLLGSESPDPMELEAVKNDLAATKLRLQAARSVTRQSGMENSFPAPPAAQAQAKDWLDTINKATSKPTLVDAAGKSVSAPTGLSDWDANFIKSVSDKVKGGWPLNTNQLNQVQRIYQAVK